MRLLQRLPGGNFQLKSFDDDDRTPQYAILSHTWTEGQEVTYCDLISGTGNEKTGFEKIRFCSEQAAADRLQYFWVDTCCIDKSANIELSTAINSMFKWYQRATRCYVYLSDVSVPDQVSDAAAFQITWADAFRRSRWFTRGWTLQELLAPASVEFFSREGKLLGSKIKLEKEISTITKIPVSALREADLGNICAEERMSWAASRVTTIKEDTVYCLLGVFGVFLPLIYGEGEVHARRRLEEEIQKQRGRELGQTCNISAVYTARPETTRPTYAIPFHRDPDFIVRGTLLDELQQKFSVPASRVALVGLGGVGKSQLAIEFAYRTQQQSPEMWILWIHASNASRFEQSFRDIADNAKLTGRRDPEANIFTLVHDWLLGEGNRKLLFILDSFDDARFLFDTEYQNEASALDSRTSRMLRNYFSQSPMASILITTRDRDVALRLVEQDDIIMVNGMDSSQATALFLKKLGQEAQGSEEDGAQLVAALELMPLAIVQAASYISQRAPRCSVRQYIEDFQRSDRKKISLLNYEGGHRRRDPEAKNSIIITWQISFEHLRQSKPSAADLLSLMSFFDRQEIPDVLLRCYRSEAIHQRPEEFRGPGEFRFEEDAYSPPSTQKDWLEELDRICPSDRNKLRDFDRDKAGIDENWSDLSHNGDSISHDSLTGVAFSEGSDYGEEHLREDNISDVGADDDFESDILTLRDYSFISCTTRDGSFKMHRLVQVATQAWLAADGQLERWKRQFLLNLCLMFPPAEYEDWDKCQTLFPHAILAVTQEPIERHWLIYWASLLHNSAWYASSVGNTRMAKSMTLKAIKAKNMLFGQEHAETVRSMELLASVLCEEDRLKEAEKVQKSVVENRTRLQGSEHPLTLASTGNLAIIHLSQGRFKEAEVIQAHALDYFALHLGATHVDTLTCMSDLALTYQHQRRLKQAEQLHLQVLEGRKMTLGADHPNTLMSMLNLAQTYDSQGQLKEAEELELHALETCKTKLGADHPYTLISRSNLARTYYRQGRLKQAEQLDLQVLEGHKTKFGADHPKTLRSRHNLALTYYSQGRLKEAEELGLHVEQEMNRVLCKECSGTLSSMARPIVDMQESKEEEVGQRSTKRLRQ